MTQLRSDVVFSMPWAMVQHLPFREQVRAVTIAGFQEMSLQPFNLLRSLADGLTLMEMKGIMEGEGVRAGRIDPLTAWTPAWQAHNFDLDFSVSTAIEASALFDLAAHFEASHVSLNAMWHPDRYSFDELVEHYAAICGRAGHYGLTCDIEPIPMWGIRTLEDALKIIEASRVPNAGIVLDTTHLCRGATDLAVLAAMPRALVTTVQLCDGYMPMPTDMTLEQECFSRMWPGAGGFPLAEILDALDKIGGLRSVGPEVFSPSYALEHTPADRIGTMARESMLKYEVLRQPA